MMGNQWGLGLHLIFVSFFLVATTYTCYGDHNLTVGCHERERLALLDFKHSVKDDFKMLSSWVGIDCCSWKGVRCDGDTGSVSRLHLRGNYYSEEEEYYLVGDKVNSYLVELSHLKHLDLSGNDFGGSRIPEFIGSFKQLSYLNLSDAGFSGIIPHHIGNLSNLKVLDLRSSFLLTANDMAWITGLSSLEHLDLSQVDFYQAKRIDMVLHMIPSLTYLSLSGCGLSNAVLDLHVNSIERLTSLRVLNLEYNQLTGLIPKALERLRSLEELDLSDNNLTGPIPTFLGKLTKLDLSRNQFSGSIPAALGRLTGLTELYLSSNQLTGQIPASLGRLTSLTDMDLFSNQLTGPIPASLGRLTSLTELYLSSNQLTGPIPASLGRLTSLIDMDLSSNQLTGPIPASLGRLASLQILSMSSNLLNEELPVSVGQLTKLLSLNVSNNDLEGVVSEAHFANLSILETLDTSSNHKLFFNISHGWVPPFQLRSVDLSSCKIEHGFPHWLQTQRMLKELVLSNSSVYGLLPTWLQKMPNMYHLDLSHNKLVGPLTNLPFSFRLLLNDNRFNGPISRFLCKRTELGVFDVSRNMLSGNIPDCVGNLQYIMFFKLSSNRLSGVLPSSLGNISTLEWLILNDNNFNGELPRDFGNLRLLLVLDLGSNEFSGNIPKWIGKSLQYLTVLRLHKNNFTGNIPQSWCKYSYLRILDVAHNKLTGSIPRCIGELSGMIEESDRPYFEFGGSLNYYFGMMNVIQVIKGLQLEYTKNMRLLFNMDLSSNNLTGEIPFGMTSLILLVGLNLSHNHLNGSIPGSIGNMKALNSLDFSDNKLTGMIPPSMAYLNFLSCLNLSHNNLSGRIPTGNQLQTLTDPSIYADNTDLCGPPLSNNCSNPGNPPTTIKNKYKDADQPKKLWFYVDIMGGFATGFWGIIGVLLFKKVWRQKLFMIAQVAMDSVYVAVAVSVSKIKRGREAQ